MASRFVVVDGAADLPGQVRHACALTTGTMDSAGRLTSRLHRCEVEAGTGHWTWQTTSSGPSQADRAGPEQRMEGTVPCLADAIDHAIGAVRQLSEAGQAGAAAMAPVFVETRREPGLPRIWVCSFLCAQDPPDSDWTHLQRCTIREFPRRRLPFACEVEGVPRTVLLAGLRAGLDEPAILEVAGLGRRNWHAANLETAMQESLQAAMAGVVVWRDRREGR